MKRLELCSMSKISIDQKDEEQAMSNSTQVNFGLLLIIESAVLKRNQPIFFIYYHENQCQK